MDIWENENKREWLANFTLNKLQLTSYFKVYFQKGQTKSLTTNFRQKLKSVYFHYEITVKMNSPNKMLLYDKKSLQAKVINYLLPLWNNSFKTNSPDIKGPIVGLNGFEGLYKVRRLAKILWRSEIFVRLKMTSHFFLLEWRDKPFVSRQVLRMIAVQLKWRHAEMPASASSSLGMTKWQSDVIT